MFKYKVLAFCVVIIYFLQSFFLSYGGIGADSLSYFGIASDLPNIKTNLFPLVYPVLLRFFYEFFGDYFWSYKIINLMMVVVLLLFSWYKNFYFKETVLLFTGKSLFFAMNGALSESPFLFIFYFLLFVIHSFLNEKIKSNQFVFWASLLMVLLFGTRYSGIFVYISFMLFGVWLLFKQNNKKQVVPYFIFLISSGIGIATYLSLNFVEFGNLTGESLRGGRGEFQFIYLFRDFLGITNVIDPFIGIKPVSNSKASLLFQIVLMLVDGVFFFYFVKWYRANQSRFVGNFHYLLWIVTLVYTLGLFVSGLFQQIEEMNVRMLALANFAFFFSVLVLYFQINHNDKRIFQVSIFFLIFLTAYSLKDADWFLKYKSQIEPQMSKFKQKKYLYNNEKEKINTTIYTLPFVQEKFRYNHTNRQIGELKQSVIGTINPKIKWLKYDTVTDKNTVLYTSEINLQH